MKNEGIYGHERALGLPGSFCRPTAAGQDLVCHHFGNGLQQTTKDSDWIIPAEDLAALRGLLSRLEGELRWYHENFNTPDDLAVWPPELGGGEIAAAD